MVRIKGKWKFSVFVGHLLLLSSLAGCTGVLDSTVNPRATLEAYPTLIQEGEMITLDARESSPIEGVITNYAWDFGDGTTAETIVGFTSHSYLAYGQYIVRLTVTNDQGGTDDASASIVVNGAPSINISMPTSVRAGETALLDASNSYDPEGDALTFAWDLNTAEDSDGDGDPLNDADATSSEIFLDTSVSGIINGMLRVDDAAGAFALEPFEINVTTRTYKVTWVTETLDLTWDEYLNQGDTWSGNMTPGDSGRIMALHALLELDQDVAPPHDNFTLGLNIVDDGFKMTVDTEAGNYTTNQPAKGELSVEDMNPPGEDGLYTSDSPEALLELLLQRSDGERGQGLWIWSVIAQQSDPDPVIGDLDPDPGNDWTLTIEVIIMRPSLTEVAMSDGSA